MNIAGIAGIWLICIICLNKQTLKAQDTLRKPQHLISSKDSTKSDTTKHHLSISKRFHNAVFVDHAPKAAGIMSAVIPGLGQAYNRKYWKMPIIYGGGVLVTYLFIDNYNFYRQLQSAYVNKLNGNTANDPYPQYDATQVKSLRDYHRRNLDILALSGIGLYALNIVDAIVDAHLYKFDISDKLTLNLRPDVMPCYNKGAAYGLSFSLHIN